MLEDDLPHVVDSGRITPHAVHRVGRRDPHVPHHHDVSVSQLTSSSALLIATKSLWPSGDTLALSSNTSFLFLSHASHVETRDVEGQRLRGPLAWVMMGCGVPFLRETGTHYSQCH